MNRMDRHLPVSRPRSPIIGECPSEEAFASLSAENSVDVFRRPAILLPYSLKSFKEILRDQNKNGFI
ncbi:hypothetical protein [Alloalcanivorax profundimaris]|uniref:hypothetical protein n=1 Tax=Alloalcanivorax profundimaris TaxID=2735259 RepID=UPI001890FF47|nr:hypothetical protein [Alloalcanivorax profundimaris]